MALQEKSSNLSRQTLAEETRPNGMHTLQGKHSCFVKSFHAATVGNSAYTDSSEVYGKNQQL